MYGAGLLLTPRMGINNNCSN